MGEQQGKGFIFSFITQNAQPQNMVCDFFALMAACEKCEQSILRHQGLVISNITSSRQSLFGCYL